MGNKKEFKIVVLMTEYHLYGRELIKLFIASGFKIGAIIIERGTSYSQKCKAYLKNDFYTPPAFSEIVKNQDIDVVYTENHNSEFCRDKLSTLRPDVILLGGTRILKDYIISTAKIGILNCHPGLLPKYRGLDPVGWSIYNGDEVGATCHFIDPGIDSGSILIQKKVKWETGDSLLKIRMRVMRVCAELMLEAVNGLKNKNITPIPQTDSIKSYPAMPPEVIKKVEDIVSGKS